MAINSQTPMPQGSKGDSLLLSGPGVNVREDPAMEEMPLIEGKGVAVSDKLEARLSRIPAVEKIVEIPCSFLKGSISGNH